MASGVVGSFGCRGSVFGYFAGAVAVESSRGRWGRGWDLMRSLVRHLGEQVVGDAEVSLMEANMVESRVVDEHVVPRKATAD